MSQQAAVSLALGVLLAAALLPAWRCLRRGADLFAPRVAFPAVYALATGGPSIWWLLSGWYYGGVVQQHAVAALLSCASAILAFHLGAGLVDRRAPAAAPAGGAGAAGDSPEAETVVRALSLLLVGLALAALALAAARLRAETGTTDKSLMLNLASPGALRLYTLAGAAVLATGLVFLAADSRVGRGRPTAAAAAVLLVDGVLCVWNGERDVAFLVAGWLVLNAPWWPRRRLATALLLLALFAALVPLVRVGGIGWREQRQTLRQIRPRHLAAALLVQTSSNFYVMTNVVDWVPAWESYRGGGTYLMSLRSFLPWDREARAASLPDWFKGRYAPTSPVGYGFAMDAEAYLNFGWAGPPLVFALWGAALQLLYRRARRRGAGSFAAYLWLLALVASLYSIRMDSRVLLKLFGQGAAAAGLLYAVARSRLWLPAPREVAPGASRTSPRAQGDAP